MARGDCRTGNIPDHIDERDYPLFSAEAVQSLVSENDRGSGDKDSPRPSRTLTELPPVYDQGYIGSCVANAVAAALRYAHYQYKKKSTAEKYEDFDPSRLFLYFNARTSQDPVDLDKNPNLTWTGDEMLELIKEDTGSMNRTAIHTLVTMGICDEKLWPYGKPLAIEDPKRPDHDIFVNFDETPLTEPPPANPVATKDMIGAFKQAKDYFHVLHPNEPTKDFIPPAIEYFRIFDPKDHDDVWVKYNAPPIALLEQCITDGFPFVFAIDLYDNGHNLKKGSWDNTGVMNKHTSTTNNNSRGGHALMAVGFDKGKNFLIQNSWGTSWPQDKGGPDMKGYCWIPYEYFDPATKKVNGRNLTRDFWVIKLKVDKPEKPT